MLSEKDCEMRKVKVVEIKMESLVVGCGGSGGPDRAKKGHEGRVLMHKCLIEETITKDVKTHSHALKPLKPCTKKILLQEHLPCNYLSNLRLVPLLLLIFVANDNYLKTMM